MAGDVLDDILPSTSDATVIQRASNMVPKPMVYCIPNFEELRTRKFTLWGKNTKISSTEGLRQILGNTIFTEIKDHPLREHIQAKLNEFQHGFNLKKLASGMLKKISKGYELKPLDFHQIGQLLAFISDATIPDWSYTRNGDENAVTKELQLAITVEKTWNETIMTNTYDNLVYDAMSKYVERYESRPGKKKTNLDNTLDLGNTTRTVVLKALSRCLGTFFIRCTLYAFRTFTAVHSYDGKVCKYIVDMDKINKYVQKKVASKSSTLPPPNAGLSPSSISSGRSTSSGEGSFRSSNPRTAPRIPEKSAKNSLKDEIKPMAVARTISVDAVLPPVCQPGAVGKSASVDTAYLGEMSPPFDAPPSRFAPRRKANQPVVNQSTGDQPSAWYSSPPPKNLLSSINQPVNANRALFPSGQGSYCPMGPGVTVGRGTTRSSTSTDEEPPLKRKPESFISPFEFACQENARLQAIIAAGQKENSHLKNASPEKIREQMELLEELQVENSELKDRNADLYNKKLDLEDELEDNKRKLGLEKGRSQAQVKEMGDRIKAMEEGIKNTDTRHKEQVKRLEDELKVAQKMNQELEEKAKQVDDWEKKCENLHKQLVHTKDDCKKKIAALGEQTTYLQTSFREGPKREIAQKKRIEELESKLEEAVTKIRQLEQMAEENDNREKQVEIQYKASIKAPDSSKVEKSKYEELFKQRQDLKQSLLARDQMAKKTEAELNETIAALNEEMAGLKRKISEMEQTARIAKEAEEKRQTDYARNQADVVRRHNTLVENLKRGAVEKLAKIDALEKELKIERNKHRESSSELQKVLVDLMKVEEARDRLLEEKKEANETMGQLENELVEKRGDLEKMGASHGQLQATCDEQKRKIEEQSKNLRNMEETKKQLDDKEKKLAEEYSRKLEQIERNKKEELEIVRNELATRARERDEEAVARASLLKEHQTYKEQKMAEIRQAHEQMERITRASDELIQTSQTLKEEKDENMKKFEEFRNIAVRTQDELKKKNQILIQNNEILKKKNAELEDAEAAKKQEVGKMDQLEVQARELAAEKEAISREMKESQRKAQELEKQLTETNEAALKKEDELKQMTITVEQELATEKNRNADVLLEKTKLAEEVEKLKVEMDRIKNELETRERQMSADFLRDIEELKKSVTMKYFTKPPE